MSIRTQFWKGFDTILHLLAILGMVILTLMMLVVCWEVVTRYFFGRGTVWVIEFSEYAILYITFLGTAWVLKRDGHVEMDLITNRLKHKTQAVIKGAVSILAALLCFVFTWFGSGVALEHLSRGMHQPTLVGPPDFPLLAVIPVGFFLLCVQFLRRAYRYLIIKDITEAKERVMS
jgi:TRAP-type C4-dicarboxylate transport system permease small subunit